MTNEQWIIYLYGIYPGKGTTVIIGLGLLITSITFVVMFVHELDNDRKDEEFLRLKRIVRNFLIGFSTLAVLSIFVPNKDIFLAMVATPTILESYKEENGKLNKIDSIIDKVLNRTEKLLEEK